MVNPIANTYPSDTALKIQEELLQAYPDHEQTHLTMTLIEVMLFSKSHVEALAQTNCMIAEACREGFCARPHVPQTIPTPVVQDIAHRLLEGLA